MKIFDGDLGYMRGVEPPFEPSYVRRTSVENITLRVNTCRAMVVFDADFAAQQLESMMRRLPIPDDAFTDFVKKVQEEVFQDLRGAIKSFI